MRKLTLACLIIVNVVLTSVAAPPAPVLKEIRITQTGLLKSIVVEAYNFNIVLDSVGSIIGVETFASPGDKSNYSIEKDRIKSQLDKNIYCVFNGGELRHIDELQFTYNRTQNDRVDMIGTMKIDYESKLGKLGRVERIGGFTITYSYPQAKVKSIGSIEFYYDIDNKRIERFASRSTDRSNLVVKIFHPAEDFR
ncbi:MAG: hypothetical protein GF398_14830 [Chitinivibrionales bacterium]|nr:hypothetical protein [Chitinivibrionales bacterium]